MVEKIQINPFYLEYTDYKFGFKLQEFLVDEVKRDNSKGFLLFTQHNPVFTIGKNASESNLLVSHEFLKRKKISLVKTNRGGDITYHAPKQLVIYPIIPIRKFKLTVKSYVHKLEDIIIKFLSAYGIKGERIPGKIGVWTNGAKIASLGIHISHGISYHGIAINISNNLNPFTYINPCGLTDTYMTSLKNELGREVFIEEATLIFMSEFFDSFKVKHTFLNKCFTGYDFSGTRKFKPLWLYEKSKLIPSKTGSIIEGNALHTVCSGANCPNRMECYSQKKATFLILGNECTRNCKFCAIPHNPKPDVDLQEPLRVAEAAMQLELKHIVITSVTRDDLSDGGAGIFAQTIKACRERIKDCVIEVLTPDFKGVTQSLDIVINACPDIFNHNLETIPRLYGKIRPQADYNRSLSVLNYVKEANPLITTKSGIMLGLGEVQSEVKELLKDLRATGCDMVTIGQYLKSAVGNEDVFRYVSAMEFMRYDKLCKELGFNSSACGPFVRSSYMAEQNFHIMRK